MNKETLWLRPSFELADLVAHAEERRWRLTGDSPRVHTAGREMQWRAGGDKLIYWENHVSGVRGINVEGTLVVLDDLVSRFDTWDEESIRTAAATDDIAERLWALSTWVKMSDRPSGALLEHLHTLAHHEKSAVRAMAVRLCAIGGWPELRELASEREANDAELGANWAFVRKALDDKAQ